MQISLFILFLYIANILCVTRNPQNIYWLRRWPKTKVLDVLKILSVLPDNPAIIAPTIITEEIAFVTTSMEYKEGNTPNNIITRKN